MNNQQDQFQINSADAREIGKLIKVHELFAAIFIKLVKGVNSYRKTPDDTGVIFGAEPEGHDYFIEVAEVTDEKGNRGVKINLHKLSENEFH